MAARVSASKRETEGGREPHRPEHPQLVLGEAVGGRSDGADHPLGEVFLPAHEVDHPPFQRIVEQAVDGEVAAGGVFLGGTEGDAVGMPAVAIDGVLAKGGHLDHAGLRGPRDGDHAEGGADGQGPLFGRRAGGSVRGVALVATS